MNEPQDSPLTERPTPHPCAELSAVLRIFFSGFRLVFLRACGLVVCHNSGVAWPTAFVEPDDGTQYRRGWPLG